MATPYNPKNIINLLKIASWKSESTLSHSGFGTLESCIIAYQVKTGKSQDCPPLKQKYLSDLLSEAKSALQRGEILGKNPSHINELLKYIGYTDWDTFENSIEIIGGFMDYSKIDHSAFNAISISLFQPKSVQNETHKILAYSKKTLDMELAVISKDTSEAPPLSELLNLTKETPYIIWVIDNEWNEALKDAATSEQVEAIMNCGQIIPIRIGQTLSEQYLRCSFIDKNHDSSGQIGLFMALAVIENLNTTLTDDPQKKQASIGLKTKIDTFNNSGTFINEQNITGENITFGNLTQHINKKED